MTMKRIVQVQELEGEGLEALLGRDIFIFGSNYNYAGKLVGVNDADIILEDAGIVFETGAFSSPGFKDIQRFPVKEWRLRIAAIESYGEMA
jgi:hypothetical protein